MTLEKTKEEILARMDQINEITEVFPEMKAWGDWGNRHLNDKFKKIRETDENVQLQS